MDSETFKNMELDDQVKLAIHSKDEKELDVIARSNCDLPMLFAAKNVCISGNSLDIMSKNTKSRTVLDAILGNLKLWPSTRERIQKVKATLH